MAQRYTASTATISECNRYRYSLERAWSAGTSRLLVIGLNPSTADSSADDPTVRRCVGFAKQFGFDGLLIGNLFAARSTSPVALRSFEDPIGPDNDMWLQKLQAKAGRVVVAWGNGGRNGGRSAAVIGLLRDPYCFGKTRMGEPLHPLYLPGSADLVRF
jgi:hypothetical protein